MVSEFLPSIASVVLHLKISSPYHSETAFALGDLLQRSSREHSSGNFSDAPDILPGIRIVAALNPAHGGRVLRVSLESGQPFQIGQTCLNMNYNGVMPARMFCNGWQSWSESRDFSTAERIRPVLRPFRRMFQPYGDQAAYQYPDKAGQLHSWSWTVWRGIAEQYGNAVLAGSLDDHHAFTCFAVNAAQQSLRISRDIPSDWPSVESAGDRHVRDLFHLYFASGPEQIVYDGWFAAQGISARKAEPCTGWTSWYRYYTRISEESMNRELDSLAAAESGLTWFQVDDGWQPRTGDWTTTNRKFPHGLRPLADRVKALGMRPGLWVAPFIAEKSSDLLRKNPGWAELDEHGRKVPAGYNPLWSGTFYALNPDHPGLRAHLREVFRLIFEDWGFELVKLDFLYAASLHHRQGRPRAERMRSAMEFLRECAGEKFILGCGVPLASAFGLVEYCRIGADVHLSWEHRLLAWLRNRERVSTRIALASTIGRRNLDGRAFLSDPDVFILRDDSAVKLSREEQCTLLLCNRLFGSLIFCSDQISAYSPQAAALFFNALPPLQKKIEKVSDNELRISVWFSAEGEHYFSLINLRNQPWTAASRDVFREFPEKVEPCYPESGPSIFIPETFTLPAHASRVFRVEKIQE